MRPSLNTEYMELGRAPASSARQDREVKSVPLPTENALDTAQRRALLEHYGTQSSSYFNLQKGVEHFGAEGMGYVSYFRQRFWGMDFNIAFTRPICARSDVQSLIKSLESTTQRPTVFMAVDSECAGLLADLGYRCNDIGVEYSLGIHDFDLKGRDKKYLRWASNFAQRGFEVKEQSWDEVDAQRVYEISRQWLGTKAVSSRELRLITRPPDFEDAWKVRKFFCYQHGRLVGFVFFDPFFENGRILGYTANILRACPGVKPNGLLDFTILEAMKRFRAEGVSRLSLGLAPLHELEATRGEIKSLRYFQQWMYRYGNFLYAFQALAYHKTRYRAESEHWYQCIPEGISIPRATIATLKAIRVI